MRRIIIFIFIILLSSLTISCEKNKSISKVKLEGDLIEGVDVQKLYWEYDKLYYNKKYPYYDGDYKLDLVVKTDMSDSKQKIKMTTIVYGEIHDSKIYFDNKMDLTINYYIEYENLEENSKGKIVIKSKAILYEGICYYDVKVDSVIKGDKENSTIKSNQKIKVSLEDLMEVFELDDIISINSSVPIYAQNNKDFFEGLEHSMSSKTLKFYKGNNTYCYEVSDTDNYLEQYLLKSDEEFNNTFFQSYYYEAEEKVDKNDSSIVNKSYIEVSYKVKTIKKTNILRPFNYKKYIDGSFSIPL